MTIAGLGFAAGQIGGGPERGLQDPDRSAVIMLAHDLLAVDLRPPFNVERERIEAALREDRNLASFQDDWLKYLITHPEELNKPIGEYGSIGHYAAQNSHTKLFSVLKRFPDYDLDLQDRYGNTILHYAAQALNIELVRDILLFPVNTEVRNGQEMTPLEYLTNLTHPGAANRQEIMHLLVG